MGRVGGIGSTAAWRAISLDTVPFGRPIASAIRVSDSPSRSPSSIRTRSTADNRLHIFAIHHLYHSVAPVFPSKLESVRHMMRQRIICAFAQIHSIQIKEQGSRII